MTAQANGVNLGNSGNNKQPELSAKKETGRKIASFLFLPGFLPQIRELARGKFGYLAFLIANIYQIVRILPKNHPYTKPQNIGKFGLRQVIAEAANHIKMERENIDQIVIFFAVLAGLILMVAQFISFLFFIFMGHAWAQPAEAESLFITQNPNEDVAFYMIREIFGLPTMFGQLEGGITGLHVALHTLFQFYNFAILFVAVLIFLYYVITVVGETATTGIPFGQRFSHIYAPFRLVIAIGLLVPLNYGFNGSQYITFYAAKLGSSFATNGWVRFNTVLATTNPLGSQKANLIAEPNIPDLGGLVKTMSIIQTCRAAYGIMNGGDHVDIQPYFVNNQNQPQVISDANYVQMRDELRISQKKAHISIYFGALNTGDKAYPGASTPYCGSIKLPILQNDQPILNLVGAGGPEQIQRNYYRIIFLMWEDTQLINLGRRIAYGQHHVMNPCVGTNLPGDCGITYKPTSNFKKERVQYYNTELRTLTSQVFETLRDQVNFIIQPEILITGWGGAGIWYNKIAEVNGAFVTVLVNIPNVEKKPQVMEKVLKEKQKANQAFNSCDSYRANLADSKSTKLNNGAKDDYYSRAFNETHQYWTCDEPGDAANFFLDSISAIMGLNGLFNVRKEFAAYGGPDNILITQQIHPLAKLSAIGKGLVESAVMNMGFAVAASGAGGMLSVIDPNLGKGLEAASGMFVSIATIGLSIGFTLYYVLPFLPFIYFFFALGGWVKGIFEAMVGAPLWALAHLRIDGDGLPGRSALNGYLLIFEIFLRPILTVFGLIGGLAVFTAMANILNEVFDIVTANVTGAKPEAGVNLADQNFDIALVDNLFFTIVYAIILYMMATASFKMINFVPNNILRWMGQSVEAFNDKAQDPAASLTQYAAISGQQVGGKLAKASTDAAYGLGSAAGAAIGK